MTLSFSKKLTASYVFVVAVTLAFTGLFLTPRLKRSFLNQLETSMAVQASLLAEEYRGKLALPSSTLEADIQALGRRTASRITVIQLDGKVLADSDRNAEEIAAMDNHAGRPEVQDALRLRMGEAFRYSATLHEDMLYVAVPILSQRTPQQPMGVLRVALPLTEVDRRVTGFQKNLIIAGIAALGVALGVALLSVRRINEPLERLMAMVQRIQPASDPATAPAADEFEHLAGTVSKLARRIEEKVAEVGRERTQLSAMLSALVEAVIALDDLGKILFLNPAAERLFGVSSSKAKNRPFLEGLRNSPLNDIFTRALQEHRSVKQEITIHAPVERTLSVHAVPITYGEGQTGVLAAIQDITELRKLESVRREFVANVSHELKTPLTSIKGYIDTLLDGALEDPAHNREFLGIIQDHANNLSQLIDDVLDLSAIEAKRVQFRFEAVSLADVLARIVKGVSPMAKAKRVAVQIKIPASLPAVKADREKLTQILLNLIDNAIKFNKTDGRVTVSANEEDGHIEIGVEDTGTGIPPEDLPRIFERFYRADKSHSKDIPGTGLGLAIVKHLVEAHNGTIRVESTLGQGSRFLFTLPKST